MNKLILVIEDRADMSALVQYVLQDAGYAVYACGEDSAWVREAEKLRPALFVLNITCLPQDWRTCKAIRQSSRLSATPILCLSRHATEDDRVKALECGADDYLAEPFNAHELVARVVALQRRFARSPGPAIVNIADLELDTGAMTLQVRGQPVPLTATEFRLLEYLVRHPGQVFGRETLIEALRGHAEFISLRSVDVFVWRLRDKLGDHLARPRYIHTIRGAGYSFRPELATEE